MRKNAALRESSKGWGEGWGGSAGGEEQGAVGAAVGDRREEGGESTVARRRPGWCRRSQWVSRGWHAHKGRPSRCPR